jgi:ParB/RepB/Spo0J family partition protein
MAAKIDAGDVKRGDLLFLDPLEIIVPEGFNGRHFAHTPEAIRERAENMALRGQLQPIRIRRRADFKVEITSGFLRHAAALLLRKSNPEYRIQAVMDTAINDLDAFMANVDENRQRSSTNPIDDAYNIDRFIAQFGWEAKKVAEFYGMTPTKVGELRKLKALPERAQRLVASGRLKVAPALMLLALTEEDMAPILAQKERLTDDDLESEGPAATLYPPVSGLPALVGDVPTPTVDPDSDGPADGPADVPRDPMTGAPLKFDPKTGRPLAAGKSAKGKATPKPPKVGAGRQAAQMLRDRGQKIKRSLPDLKEFLVGRNDDVSLGLLDYLDGSINDDDLVKRLERAQSAIDARMAGGPGYRPGAPGGRPTARA